VFQTTNMAIADVQWSFDHACVFAVASTDGHMEVLVASYCLYFVF